MYEGYGFRIKEYKEGLTLVTTEPSKHVDRVLNRQESGTPDSPET